MKKYLLPLLLALMVPFCFAQSYPSPTYKNLTVTTTFTATGLVTTADLATQAANTVLANVTASTASPTAATLPSCGAAGSALNYTLGTGFSCNTSITATALNGTAIFTANPTISTATYYPTVPTNAALQALSTVSIPTVTRLGFYVAGDVAPITYTASASACSLNSGNGDNGSQVKSANSLCWIADFSPIGPLEVKEWGAYGDNSHNDTTAMQSAFNMGRVIHFSQGTYLFTSGITMAAGSGIVGDSASSAFLATTDTTSTTAITYSATNTTSPGTAAPIFRDFTLIADATKTGSIGLLVTAPSGENSGARFLNITIDAFPTDLSFGAASTWSIQNSFFLNYTTQGIFVENTNNSDSGDSVIAGSYIGTGTGAGVGIYYANSGGLKIIGNKFNGGSYGIFLGLAGTASTSDLLITGNSIENMNAVGIELSRASGTASFSNIVISGNQLAINLNGIVVDTSGAIAEVTVTGNVIGLTSGTGVCINFGTATYFTITGNTCIGNGGTPVGISISATSGQGKIGPNQYFGLTSTLVNSAGSVWYTRDKQVVSATITTSSAFGTVFAGSAAVTFPTAFTVTPEVLCNPTTGGSSSGVSAYATAVTKTGFTANGIGATSGGSVPVTCWAEGII